MNQIFGESNSSIGLAKEGPLMTYVYILQSTDHSDQFYIGWTEELSGRAAAHNARKSAHTSKLRPWEVVFYAASIRKRKKSDLKERRFEQYFRGGSRAFLRRHVFSVTKFERK
jgi:putative endonuclease